MNMLEKETQFKSAGYYAWCASRDASMRSAVNASRFSSAQKLRADRVKLALELVYTAKEVSITNCKKWIRVKVHGGTVRDKKALQLLESDWAMQGIQKNITPQGVIYRVA